MVVKIFVQDKCPNCPPSKELGQELITKGVEVNFFDIRTSDGLAESLMHNVLSTPSMVIVKDGKEIKSYFGETPTMDEVLKWL